MESKDKNRRLKRTGKDFHDLSFKSANHRYSPGDCSDCDQEAREDVFTAAPPSPWARNVWEKGGVEYQGVFYPYPDRYGYMQENSRPSYKPQSGLMHRPYTDVIIR